MVYMQIALLGAFDVTINGEPVTGFGYDKVRALLAYLAMEAGRPQRREFLASLLWPDHNQSDALHNLSQAIYRLRSIVGNHGTQPSWLYVTPASVQINCTDTWWLDAQAFVELLAPYQDPLHAETTHTPARCEHLQQAAALYRGDFLQGFSLPGCESFGEWQRVQQERLHALAVTALRNLATFHERHREHDRCLYYARRWLELEPWNESAHQQVMRTLALMGERAAALAQFVTCQRVLWEELGVEPNPETLQLYQAIRDGADLSGVLPADTRNLPPTSTPLIGRKAELAAIERKLHDADCRLLALVGLGGCGKTTLALKAAADQAEHFVHGVYFVSLAAVPTADGIVPALCQALGFTAAVQADPQQQLLAFLREKQMLLIFDAFEHLAHGVDVVLEILRAAPGIKAIVTSRMRLNTQVEHTVVIGGLSYPENTEPGAGITQIENVTDCDAVELFLLGTRRVRPDVSLSACDMAAVVRICRAVEGMPLALLLAASWVNVLSLAEIAACIDDPVAGNSAGLDLLTTDWRDVPERQRSMRSVFEQSWQMLTPGEQTILAELSVFRGGFTRTAAQAVTDVTIHQLRELTNRCLVQVTPGGRYQMHDLLRQFASEKLAQSPDTRDRAERQQATYVCTALQRWASDLQSSGQQTALAEMEAEVGNIYVAWEWATTHKAVDDLAQGLDGLCQFCAWRGRYTEGTKACNAAANAIGGESAPDARRLAARTLIWIAVFDITVGSTTKALDALQRSQAMLDTLATSATDITSERAFWWRVAGLLHAESNREYARRCGQQSLRLYRILRDRWNEANVLNDLGWLSWQVADYAEAKTQLESSLQLRRWLGDRRGMAETLRNLGAVATLYGLPADAEAPIREAVELSRTSRDLNDLATSLYNLGSMLVFTGRFEEGRAALHEASSLYDELGTKKAYEVVADSLLWCELQLGRYASARRLAYAVLTTLMASANAHMIAVAYGALGEVALIEGDYHAARQFLDPCLAGMTKLTQNDQACVAKAELARIDCLEQQFESARQQLEAAQQLASHGHGMLAVVYTLGAAIEYNLATGHLEQAVELYAAMRTHPYVANSRWWHDALGERVDKVAASLSSAVAAAAQQRGAHKDLRQALADAQVNVRPEDTKA